MATLVLTTIGTAVGGPIGGTVGAVVGQLIDAELFKGRPREGPRLTDLAVQTSSYGTQIPQVFGAMRIAGSVIWSTDLIETRTRTGGGKGQPGTNNYAYAVSFAVLLSARPISRVGRIWADGNLLRGADGDFKAATGFRLHRGGDDQEVDPLIAAAEGALAPAHRGHAYAVFENLQLADYGNRIPSMTFEVFADEAPVAIGTIAEAIGGGLVEDAGLGQALPGFSAYGDSARGVLEGLAQIGGGWFAPVGRRLALRGGAAPDRALADQGVGTRTPGHRRAYRVAAIETVPQVVTVAHYDPARDYQIGLQRARRPGAGHRERRLDLAAAIDAASAKGLAEAALSRDEAGRETRRVALDWAALDLVPGAVISIVGESGRWRVAGWSLEAMVLTLDLVRLGAAAPARTASSGRVLSSPDRVAGQTILHAFELPSLDDALLAVPRLLVAAAGTAPGWRRAALLYSLDGGARWTAGGATALPATIGSVVVPPARSGSALRDLAGFVDIDLAHEGMTLADADDAGLDSGGNLALVGDELLQFGRAEPLGGRRWRLSRLLRGRRGTEAAAGGQLAGDRFVLIEREALVAIDLPLAAIGGVASLIASGIGDGEGGVRVDAAVTGASVRPPAPVRLRRDLAAGQLRWTRRSRLGWSWTDGGDAPLGEESEHYRITLADGASIEAAEPTLSFAGLPAGPITVRQRGTSALSAPVRLD